MYICVCHAVTDRAIRQAAEEGVRTMSELRLKTGCGSQCGSCASTARELLSDANREIDTLAVLSVVKSVSAA
jgi:bacterioferritin-associated ferredoxin